MTLCPIARAGVPASGQQATPVLIGLAAVLGLTLASGARAGEKRSAPAPAPHASAAPGRSMGGGAHMPGSMGGGAHIPGSMGGGAHVPGSMGHSSPEMHRTQSESHPGASHGESHARSEPHRGQSEAMHHSAGASSHEAHGAPAHEARAGAHGGERAGEHGGERAGEHGGEHAGEHGDPRIGGRAALHTRLAAGAAIGVGAGLAAHHFGAGGVGHDFRARPVDRDVGRERAFAEAHAHDFHARNVRDFTAAEFGRWRGGSWGAGWHFGRFGWWWDVDGVWYPYDAPIYPFPLEVSAITVYGDDYIAVPALAQAPGIPPLPAAPAALYSCASPPGYFPAVAACGQPWQMADAPQQTDAPPN